MTRDTLHLEVPEILNENAIIISELKQRLGELQQLPHDEALQQTLTLLTAINRNPLTLLERQRALQSLCDQYCLFCNHLQSDLSPHPNFVQLCKELAIGFKHLLLQIVQSRHLSKPHLAWCLYMAMYFQAQSQLRHYQLYIEPPLTLWSDIHQLYQLGEQHDCLDEHIAAPFQPSSSSTLRGLYQQMLIMALSNPFHLHQGQCVELFNALTPLAELARLLPWEADDEQDTPVVDLSKPLPYIPTEHAQQNNASCLRRIELGPLLIALHDPAPLQSLQQHDLLEQVSKHWNCRQQRRHERSQLIADCELVIGLQQIHAHLLEKRPPHFHSQILDSSAGGARLLCSMELGQQLPVGQLLLVLSSTGTPCLALIRWRHLNQQGLHIGLRYLKGLPRAAWLRRTPSATTHPGVLQSTPEPGSGWHHGLWLPDGQFVEGENIWLQLANASNQAVLTLPATNMTTVSVARYPLRLA